LAAPDPDSRTRLRQVLAETDAYVNREGFRGYDPYDALSSPLFKLPILRSSHYARLGAQQVLKRVPVNVRPLLGIRKRLSAVSLARMLEGYAHLFALDAEKRDRYRDRMEVCLGGIEALRSSGYSGDCWGYEWDWEPHYASRPLPAGLPNIVATGIVSNALFEAHRLAGIESARDSCISAAEFVMHDLERTPADESFCWGYFPGDRQQVLNATMKAARLCAQVFSLTRDRELADAAAATVKFVAERQRADGAWPYSTGDTRTWVDNFHTGYVLECLHAYGQLTGDSAFEEVKARGSRYYRASFVSETHVPKYLDRRLTPVDATACAQTITTLCILGDVDEADAVASWTLENMRRRDGGFVYQRHRYYTNRIAYMRWSTAPMFAALTRLLFAIEAPVLHEKRWAASR
jgi:hypothetical protein